MMALEQIKVIDLSTSGPGNFATMYLGDLGAEVILVAPPPSPVGSRATGEEEGDANLSWDRVSHQHPSRGAQPQYCRSPYPNIFMAQNVPCGMVNRQHPTRSR